MRTAYESRLRFLYGSSVGQYSLITDFFHTFIFDCLGMRVEDTLSTTEHLVKLNDQKLGTTPKIGM